MCGTARQVGNLSQQMRETTSTRVMFVWTLRTTTFMSKHRVLQEAFSIKPGCSTTTSGDNEQSLVYKFWMMLYRPNAPICRPVTKDLRSCNGKENGDIRKMGPWRGPSLSP